MLCFRVYNFYYINHHDVYYSYNCGSSYREKNHIGAM